MSVLTFPHVDTGGGFFFAQWAHLNEVLAGWRQRSRNRNYLAHLDRYQRANLGAPLSAVEREMNKPFWRA